MIVCLCVSVRERERERDRQTYTKIIEVERASSSKVPSLLMVFLKTLLRTLPATTNQEAVEITQGELFLLTKEWNSMLSGRADFSIKEGMCRRHSGRLIPITLCPKFFRAKILTATDRFLTLQGICERRNRNLLQLHFPTDLIYICASSLVFSFFPFFFSFSFSSYFLLMSFVVF